MSAALAHCVPAVPVEVLAALIRANRYLPMPPPALMSCGDGDWRAIGAEFLVHFVRLGGLLPTERVLDLGCGVGRMAIPLTQYLDGSGTYLGLDVQAAAIAWCSAALAPYPRCSARHWDVVHPLYNPSGSLPADAPLPVADGSMDFVAMVSVATHLDVPAIAHLARQVARVLAPGGRCLVTAFLLNPPSRAAIGAGATRPSFALEAGGMVGIADPAAPLAAIAHDEDRFLAAFLAAGLRRRRPAAYGSWSGRSGPGFQDICILER